MSIDKMEALEAALLPSASPQAVFFAEAPSLDDLQARLETLTEQMQTVQARADAESRALDEDEEKALADLFKEFEDTEGEIDRRERIAAAQARAQTGRGRVTQPDDSLPRQDPQARAESPQRRRAEPRAIDRADAERHGFRHMGEFCASVRRAAAQGGREVDPRLIMNAAPGEFGREGIGEDGGFAVPPEFRRNIIQTVMAEESLIGRTDRLTSSSNSITVPIDETTPWQTTGGIQAYWEAEAAQFTASKPKLDNATVRLHKLTALVPVTEELLEDAPALAGYINAKTPQKIDYKLTDAIINGVGAGQPLGILKSPALVTVDAEGSQAPDSVVFDNIVNMWSRMYAPCRQRAVWLINSDVEPQLMKMQFPGTGTAVPVYLPPGGLADAPYGRLLNRPVLPMEACPTLGDVGDIILTDLSTYMTATKGGGIRSDVSMHLYFDYDMTAYRFILRVAGQPWWKSPIAKAKGGNTLSCSVTLAERA